MTYNMDKVRKCGLMGVHMKVSIAMERNMVKVLLIGKINPLILATSSII